MTVLFLSEGDRFFCGCLVPASLCHTSSHASARTKNPASLRLTRDLFRNPEPGPQRMRARAERRIGTTAGESGRRAGESNHSQEVPTMRPTRRATAKREPSGRISHDRRLRPCARPGVQQQNANRAAGSRHDRRLRPCARPGVQRAALTPPGLPTIRQRPASPGTRPKHDRRREASVPSP